MVRNLDVAYRGAWRPLQNDLDGLGDGDAKILGEKAGETFPVRAVVDPRGPLHVVGDDIALINLLCLEVNETSHLLGPA